MSKEWWEENSEETKADAEVEEFIEKVEESGPKGVAEELIEMIETIGGKMGGRPPILMGSPTVVPMHPEPEEDIGEEEEGEKSDEPAVPKDVRVIVLHDEGNDKVIIALDRKGRYMTCRGSREGLSKITHISTHLEVKKSHSDFEEMVKDLLRENWDYIIAIDEEVDSTSDANDIVKTWAATGELPHKDDGTSGGWWDVDEVDRRWGIPKGIE